MTQIERIHEGDREATLTAIGEQASELHEQDCENTITCPCGTTGPLPRMFRCFYCEVWFCPGCAGVHFEGEHPEPVPLPMDVIEQIARLDFDSPLFDLIKVPGVIGDEPDLAVPVEGLRDELTVIEEAVDNEFDRGNIRRDTRLGALIAVAGLRDVLRRAEDGR